MIEFQTQKRDVFLLCFFRSSHAPLHASSMHFCFFLDVLSSSAVLDLRISYEK